MNAIFHKQQMLASLLNCLSHMSLARHVVLLLIYTLAFGMELLNMLRTQIDPQYMFMSHVYPPHNET